MAYNREAGHVVEWDGERGMIARLSAGPREPQRLAFTAADVIEGEPAAGHRCTYTPARGDSAKAVRAKGAPC